MLKLHQLGPSGLRMKPPAPFRFNKVPARLDSVDSSQGENPHQPVVPTMPTAPCTPPRRWPFGAPPARKTLTLGLPSLYTTTATDGPIRPQFGVPCSAPAVSSSKMGERKLPGMNARVDRSMATLHEAHRAPHGHAGEPDTERAMTDFDGFKAALQTMFGPEFGTDKAQEELAERLKDAVPVPADEEVAHIEQLVLATALRSVGVTNLAEATALLDAAAAGQHTKETFRLERLLATSEPGMLALIQLRKLSLGETQKKALRDRLLLCTALEEQGLIMSKNVSASDVLHDLQCMGKETNMDAPIGHGDDQRLQLLAQALKYATDKYNGAACAGPQRSAYVAWKKGGFVCSGKGTNFNRAIGRLQKFSTYVDRANHGDRTLGNMARDVRNWFGRTVGVGKSPLTPMRHGTQGGDLDLLKVEQRKLNEGLSATLSAAIDNLTDELRDPLVWQNQMERDKCLAKAAVFSLWQETGHTTFTHDEVLARAGRVIGEIPNGGGVYVPTLLLQLKGFTSPARGKKGDTPAILVRMAALEAMGEARTRRSSRAALKPTAPESIREELATLRKLSARTGRQQARFQELKAQRRQLVSALLADMRAIENPGSDSKALFKLSDLKAILRGKPRQGPGPEDAERVMTALAHGKHKSMATFTDGASHGAGTFGTLPLLVTSALGTPMAAPVLRAERGRRAVVTIGVSNTGARFFVGTEKSRSATIGAIGGWSTPRMLNKLLTASALAEATVGHTAMRSEGVVITARSDNEKWQETVPAVTKFMFEQASRDCSGGRATNASELWSRFAEAFHDDEHLAISWNSEHTESTHSQIGAAASARVRASPQTAIGPTVSAALRAESSRSKRTPSTDGADVPSATHARRFGAIASAGISQTAPFVAEELGAVAGWRGAVPLVGATAEWALAGGIGTARLGRHRDGSVSPRMCQREIIFQTRQSLLDYAEHTRGHWEARLMKHDGSGTITEEVARAHFNSFLAEAAAAPDAADGMYSARYSLARRVAEKINHFEARLNALQGRGDRKASARELSSAELRECDALQNAVQKLLAEEKSWRYRSLGTYEQNQTNGTSGLNLGLRIVSQEQARTLRQVTLLQPVPVPSQWSRAG